MEQFIFIVALLAIGKLLQRFNAPTDFAKSLNFFIIFVSLPATVLLQIPKATIDSSTIILAVVPWALLLVTFFAVLLITKDKEPKTRAALLLVVPLGNTSFLGIPLISSLLGEEAVPFVLIYDQFGSFFILAIYASIVVAHYEHGTINKQLIVKKLFSFPPFLALIIALCFDTMPAVATPYIKLLSSTLVPIAIISVGYSIRFKERLDFSLFGKALFLKLVAMPLLAFFILFTTGVNEMVLRVGVLESAMPSMITAGAIAIAAGFAPELSAALVGYGIIISLATIPLINYLL